MSLLYWMAPVTVKENIIDCSEAWQHSGTRTEFSFGISGVILARQLKCHYLQIFGLRFFCRKVEVPNKQHAKPLGNTKTGTTFFSNQFLVFFRPPLFKCESPRHAVMSKKLVDMTSMTQPVQMKLVVNIRHSSEVKAKFFCSWLSFNICAQFFCTFSLAHFLVLGARVLIVKAEGTTKLAYPTQ